ncbi:Uncharacterized protein TPAR_03943 [Tolypocladium paradoxum]|uniref:Uncharacterized protein n=1 Tax=Tolypocladium paradoxum TaxID=94208 RepID=A0A2S4L092_9HYPO|nr:Uncharacterized protein TPAR_03943 [Tolypocladium paradoxum]
MAKSSIVSPQQGIIDRWVRDDDDWSGFAREEEDPKPSIEETKQPELHDVISAQRPQLATAFAILTSPRATTQRSHTDAAIGAIMDAIRTVNILDPGSEHNRMVLQCFEGFAYHLYMSRTPQVTLLPGLSQFNFIRALLANVDVLGLSSDQMSDDALSPFNSLCPHQASASATLLSRLPAKLRPTDLQCATLHHPWIDLLPVPEMRDNLFRRGLESFDEDELCHALRRRIPSQNPGVLEWRDPWDPGGWEVTEAFLGFWGWNIAGCWDLFRSTNKWRAQRGEMPLFRP